MAIAIKTEHEKDRQDTFRVHPADVALGRNSRMVPAPNYAETVRDRAVSIYKQGQLMPVEVRRAADKSLVLNLGYTRKAAVELIREGFDAIDPDSGVKVRFHDPERLLWVKVVDCGPDDAFLHGIAENLERADTTDLQEALAQQELRTTMGWTNAQIARFYKYTNQNRVAALEKLLSLPDEVQQAVHVGRLALYAALDTLKLTDEAERARVLEGATEGGKIDGALLRSLIREALLKDAPVPVPEVVPDGPSATPVVPAEDKPTRIKRTTRELQNWIAEVNTREDITEPIQDFLKTLSFWLNGSRTDATLWNKLYAVRERK